MAIVYQHRRKDTGEIFYIGIGKDIRRAYSTEGRNARWQDIVSQSGYSIEILHKDIERDEAEAIEKSLIETHGREDKGEGVLCNRTAGGERISRVLYGNEYEETDNRVEDKLMLLSCMSKPNLFDMGEGIFHKLAWLEYKYKSK